MKERSASFGYIRPVVTAGAALVGATIMASILLALGGHDPVAALVALVQGSFGSVDRVVSFTLVRSTPLLFTGLAVALAFKAGVWNIGAEGQLYAGAMAGIAAGLALPGAPAILLLPITIGAGLAF